MYAEVKHLLSLEKMLNRTFQFLWSKKICESEGRVKTPRYKKPYGREKGLMKTNWNCSTKQACTAYENKFPWNSHAFALSLLRTL